MLICAIQGTQEFMSQALYAAMSHGWPYLQSPVDDLHSFFWVALWTVIYNIHNEEHVSEDERGWQMDLTGSIRTRALVATKIFGIDHTQ